MNIPDIQRMAGQFLKDNATTILTGAGVVGTVATAVLTAKSTFKAAEIIEQENDHRRRSNEQQVSLKGDEAVQKPEMTRNDKVKLVWSLYVPPVAVGGLTIASIVMSNRVSAKRAAALAAAYGLSEQRFQEYRDKVSEKLTGPKQQQVIDEIAQDRVNNSPDKEVIILSGGDALCFDMTTGRYFRSTYEKVMQAENKINNDLFHHQYASLSSFYDEVGLMPTNFSNDVGWNLTNTGPLQVRITTTKSPNNEPCLAVDFVNPPAPNFQQLY